MEVYYSSPLLHRREFSGSPLFLSIRDFAEGSLFLSSIIRDDLVEGPLFLSSIV